MVIDDFDVFRALGSRRPFERNAPLLVNSDAVLALSITDERFKAVATKLPEVAKAVGRLKNPKALFSLATEALERRDSLALGKAPGSHVPVAPNHRADYQEIRGTSRVLTLQMLQGPIV